MAKKETVILKGIEAEKAFEAAQAEARKYATSRSQFKGFELICYRNSILHGNGRLTSGFAFYPAYAAKKRPAIFVTGRNQTELKVTITAVRAADFNIGDL